MDIIFTILLQMKNLIYYTNLLGLNINLKKIEFLKLKGRYIILIKKYI